jgi:chlorite dismutase
MAEQTPETLNHFAVASFTPAYWQLAADQRRQVRADWLGALRRATDALHLYQLTGFEPTSDLFLWSASADASPGATERFFGGMAAAIAPVRQYVGLRETLWGYTRPSQYTRTRSTQELDPFAPERLPFLIAYPFVKTAAWYQLDRDTRQQMMAGHIRVGNQYKDITQLLLYSFGLQDQEFVVVYETTDLRRFLALVNDLRATEARLYTQRDWPLHTGRYQADERALDGWL